MNKVIGLVSKVMVATVVLSAVAGCNRIPFLGRQTSNQVVRDASQDSQTGQTETGVRTQPANQQAQNPQTDTQNQDVTIDPEAPNTDDGTGNNSGVSALW
jgi:hypothetical protein